MAVDYRRWYGVARVAFVGSIVLLALGMLALLVFNSLQGREFRQEQVRSTELIRSCVQPDGQCFKDAARRQADVIGDPPAPINNVVILASYCARVPGNDTEAKVRACVLEGLGR